MQRERRCGPGSRDGRCAVRHCPTNSDIHAQASPEREFGGTENDVRFPRQLTLPGGLVPLPHGRDSFVGAIPETQAMSDLHGLT